MAEPIFRPNPPLVTKSHDAQLDGVPAPVSKREPG